MDPSLMRKLLYRTGIELFTLYVIGSVIIVLVQNWWMREQPRQKRWLLWRVLVAGVVLLALFLGGAHVVAPRLVPHRNWTPFSTKEGRFAVNFPGEPDDLSKRQEFAGDYCMVYTYVMPGGYTGVNYTLSYLDAPSADFKGGPQGVMEGIRNMLVSGVRSQLLSSTPITFAGHPGLEFDYQSPNGIGVVHTRLVMSGKRIYMQWAGPLTDPKTDLNGVEFFKSFKLNEKTIGPIPPKTDG